MIEPNDAQREQAALGALLVSKAPPSGWLAPETFCEPVHALIYAMIEDRLRRGEKDHLAALKAAFGNTDQLDEVGGIPYLDQLAAIGRA